jgi:hypothetical protein
MPGEKPSVAANWWTYAPYVVAAAVIGLDSSGLWATGASVFVLLGLVAALIINLVRLPASLQARGLKGWLPLLGCLVAAPAGWMIGRAHFRLHFLVHRAQYESVAVAIQAGTYQLPLKEEDSSLGHRANVIQNGTTVVAVDFLTVSHGFAGHRGYLRAFGDETDLRRGRPPAHWSYCFPLGDGWYAVGD